MAEEQPSDKIETIIYMGLNLDVYKFRVDQNTNKDHYLVIVKEKINNELKVMGATIADEDILGKWKQDVEEAIDNGEAIDNYDQPFPVEEFLSGMEEGNWGGEPSRVQFETYRDFLGRLASRTTSENNRAIFNRMLLADEFADRYMLTVVVGPLKNCVFDADGFDINNNKPFFLGDKPMTVLVNIKDKVYYKFVSIKTDVERMQIDDRDKHRMTIAAALFLPQEGRDTVLRMDEAKLIDQFGGKKKRKSLKKKRKTKRKRKTIKSGTRGGGNFFGSPADPTERRWGAPIPRPPPTPTDTLSPVAIIPARRNYYMRQLQVGRKYRFILTDGTVYEGTVESIHSTSTGNLMVILRNVVLNGNPITGRIDLYNELIENISDEAYIFDSINGDPNVVRNVNSFIIGEEGGRKTKRRKSLKKKRRKTKRKGRR